MSAPTSILLIGQDDGLVALVKHMAPVTHLASLPTTQDLLNCRIALVDENYVNLSNFMTQIRQTAPVRLPVLALGTGTAQADAERSLQAGADAYVSIRKQPVPDLTAIGRWLRLGPRAIDVTAIRVLQGLSPQDGSSLLQELVEIFRTEMPFGIASLRAQLNGLRHAELARTAHGLKSSSANLGAERVRNLTEHLEHCLPQTPQDHLVNIIARLEKEFTLALEELEKIVT